MRSRYFFAAIVLALGTIRIHAQPQPPTTAPATQPIDPNVKALISQLGDDDPRRRDGAAAELRKLGKQALPGLELATRDEDPQIRISAQGLVAEQKEKDNPRKVAQNDPALPADVFNRPPNWPGIQLRGGNFQGQMQFRVQMTGNGQSTRDISINNNGHKVHIHEDPNGLKVEVTDNGETKSYAAKNAAELKEKEPEGYKVYEKYTADRGGPVKIQVTPN